VSFSGFVSAEGQGGLSGGGYWLSLDGPEGGLSRTPACKFTREALDSWHLFWGPLCLRMLEKPGGKGLAAQALKEAPGLVHTVAFIPY
jgi:hypothetical protein